MIHLGIIMPSHVGLPLVWNGKVSARFRDAGG